MTMKHYGDVSKISGLQIEPVDVITFGSPCQDMSVAGKREGMKHAEQGDEETTRSGLFYEAVRIIKEMRKATNGEYPKYAVWENVPGAFSSNKGRDFHAVLEALCSVCDDTVSIPKPYDPKRTDILVWNKSGEIVGDNYSVAWRTLDAQYWGVPQRRKRIYLVADFTGRCAGAILFKPDSLRGHMSQSDEAGQGVTVNAVGSVGGSVGAVGIDPYNLTTTGDNAATLGVNCGLTTGRNGVIELVGGSVGEGGIAIVQPVILNDQGGSSINVETEDVSPTLRAQSHQHEPVIAFTQNQREEVRDLGNKAGALAAEAGVHQQTYVAQPVIALQANGIDRADTAGCDGCGWRENESYTLNTIDRHAVCYDARNHNAQDISGTDSVKANLVAEKKRRYIIRRLTPTECCRLQGFPDGWGNLVPYNPDDAEFWEQVRKTYAEINGKSYKPVKNLKKWYEKLHTDGAEYKMWGNGIALPCAEYVIRGTAEQGAKTLGSLFDGSGGFPLAGVMNGIKPLWASEVEPYPIAVTKSRFKEV